MLALPIFPASHPASIVGACELNFCVRDGNRWTLTAINTNFFRKAFAFLYVKALSSSNSFPSIALHNPLVKHYFLPNSKHFPSHPRLKLPRRFRRKKEQGSARSFRRKHFAVAGNTVNGLCSDVVTRTGFEPMLTA